jgi:hypothetical protein
MKPVNTGAEGESDPTKDMSNKDVHLQNQAQLKSNIIS